MSFLIYIIVCLAFAFPEMFPPGEVNKKTRDDAYKLMNRVVSNRGASLRL